MSDRIIAIGLGELNVSGDPETTLVAYGLGSCVGVAIYDPQVRTGGMAHVVLPERVGGSQDDCGVGARYADMAIDRLATELERAGGTRPRMVVKIAGGAQLLSLPLNGHRWDIGERNIVAVKRALSRNGLILAAYEVGGSYGRTMRFQVRDGRVTVSTVGHSEMIL